MKKILLAAVGAAGLLASCGTSTVLPGYYNGTGTSSSLKLNAVNNYITSWQLSDPVQDQSGKTIPAGTYVICDNRNTDVSVDVYWTGPLSTLGLQFKGYNTGQYKNVYATPYSGAGFATVNYTLSPYTAPLSIKPQNIIVKPVTKVTVKGATYINAQGLDTSGYASNIVTTSNVIYVMDCQ